MPYFSDLLKKHKLLFDAPLEKAFYEDYYIKSLTIIRIGLILGIILYGSFGILDIYIVPVSKKYIWMIRFAVVCPALAATFILTYTPIFKKLMQFILGCISLITGLGIVAMIAVAVEKESALYYYAGLLLVIMWVYAMIRLRLVYAVAVSWIMVLAYEVVALSVKSMLSSPELINGFINNNFFFISANVIGMFVNYHMERYIRSDFLQRREIEEDERELEREKNELKIRDMKMQKELNMARLIQKELIPDSSPAEYITTFYKPMEEVGGDIFDFWKLPDGKISIFLGDVSGHGVPAALITSMVKCILKESHQFSANPAAMLMHLNDILNKQTADNYMTAFYCVYSPDTNDIVFSNAAHNPPFLLVDHHIKAIECKEYTGMPIAVVGNDSLVGSEQNYKNVRIRLPKGGKLLLYTDGLTEAKKSSDRKSSFEDILPHELLQLTSYHNHTFIEKIYSRLVAFRGIDTFDDDISMINLEVV